MKHTKQAFLNSVLAILLSISMLIGTTFAWFTDNVTSGKNIISSGNLDLEMYWTDDLNSGVWYNVEDPVTGKVFDYDNWEPGYTEVRYLKLKNAGDLALNYKLSLTPIGSVGKLAEVIQVYFDEDGAPVSDRNTLAGMGALGFLDRVMNGGAAPTGTLLADGQVGLHPSGETVVTLAMQMITTAGNEYQNQSVGDGFTITSVATQCSYEQDSFGNDYDAFAPYPVPIGHDVAAAPVTPVDGKVPTGGVTLTGNTVTARVPAGVKLADGVEKITLNVTPLKSTTSGVQPVDDEILIPVDIHIDGVAADNTVPIVIDLGTVLPENLNMGNYTLIHVEDGVNKPMTCVSSAAALTVHNTYTYDATSGAVSVAMATFSEVAFIAETAAPWKGGVDTSWYNAKDTEFSIANADQLAGLAHIVGGMGVMRDSFAGKTVKLTANLNLGDAEGSGSDHIFYPIGYWNSIGSFDKKTGVAVESDVESFEGTFDGQGHVIANFYQNTWDMFGDYNDGYAALSNHYDDAMGLFGYVKNGTVQNLTVKNFSSDGEFTPTGVIAAYACNSTFKNIAIVSCNPRVYNTGNGGIVGIGGLTADGEDKRLVFENISIDNTNTITALWGSWDVACGGLVGMFRGGGYVDMTNCHVSAKMDVYNDVCGNYQYYWYRYSGMLVGTNKNMTTDERGYTVPETHKYTTVNCTVHYGDWNNYYYCELVENSLASYTHDHQMSRLTPISALSEIWDGSTWTKTGNFILDVDTCYHIRKDKDGKFYQHKHEDSNYETNIDEDGDGYPDLKEDKQRVFLPFDQLFTGYGWGVKHIPLEEFEDTNGNKVTVLDGVTVKKFEPKLDDGLLYRVPVGTEIEVGDLFKETWEIARKEYSSGQNYSDPLAVNDAGVYVSADKVEREPRFSYDDVSSLSGNGSGKLLYTGAEYDKDGAADGRSAKLFINKGAGNYAAQTYLKNGNGLYQVTPGKTYTLTAYVRPDAAVDVEAAGGLLWGLRVQKSTSPSDSSANYTMPVNILYHSAELVSGEWTQVKTTFTVSEYSSATGSDAHYLTFMASFKNSGAVAPSTVGSGDDAASAYFVYLDNISVQELSAVATFTADTEYWKNGTLKFDETGDAVVTIQDYRYCAPTTLRVEVVEAADATVAAGVRSVGTAADIVVNDYEGDVTLQKFGTETNRNRISLETGFGHSGSGSFKINPQNVSQSETGRVGYTDANGNLIPLTVGKEYVLSAWVYVDGDFTPKFRLNTSPSHAPNTSSSGTGYDVNGIGQSTDKEWGVPTYTMTTKTREWNHVTYRFTATGSGDVTYATFGVASGNNKNHEYVYVDDLVIYEPLAVQGFDTADGEAAPPLYDKATISDGRVRTGSNALKITVSGTSDAYKTPRAIYSDASGKAVTLTKGKTYRVSAWVYFEDSFASKVRFLEAADSETPTNYRQINGVDITNSTQPTGEWIHVTWTGKASLRSDYKNYLIGTGLTEEEALAKIDGITELYAMFGMTASTNPGKTVTAYIDDVYIEEIAG